MPANGRRGRPQGQCHRKQTARARSARANGRVPQVRAKRCGKSAPRPWQQGWQGKPHREQDRIGAAAMWGISIPIRSQGSSRPAARVGRVRRVARRVPEEWPSRPANGRTEPGLQAVWPFSLSVIFPLVNRCASVLDKLSTKLSTGTKREYFRDTELLWDEMSVPR
jgi:hypothetical protein